MLSDKDPQIAKKERDLFLYKFGKHYTEQLISETDQMIATYPDIEVLPSMDEWFESYSKSFEKNQTKHSRQMQRVAVVFLCLILSFSVLTVISEANGYHFFEMIVNDKSIYSQISFINTNDVIDSVEYLTDIPKTWTSYYYLTKLPTDYYFLNSMDGFQSKYLIFTNDADEHLVFAQETLDISAVIDTENAIVEDVEINGLKGISSNKEGVTIIAWHDNSNSFILTGNIQPKTMLNIAESIKYKK